MKFKSQYWTNIDIELEDFLEIGDVNFLPEYKVTRELKDAFEAILISNLVTNLFVFTSSLQDSDGSLDSL